MKSLKLPALMLTILSLLLFSVPVSASSLENGGDAPDLDKMATLRELPNGDIEIIPHNVEKYIEAVGIQKPYPDAKLDSLKIITLPENTQKRVMPIEPLALPGSLYIKTTGTSQGTGNMLGQNSNTCYSKGGCGQLQVQVSVNTTVSNEYSSTLGVALPENIVSAGVGYTIGASVSVQNTGTYSENNVPEGKSLYIQAYARINITGFEVWEKGWFSDSKVGSGSAWTAVPNQLQVASWKNY